MSENLRDRIYSDMKEFMKLGNALKLSVVRMLISEIKRKEIDDRVSKGEHLLDDGEIVTIVGKMIKQRNDSISEFEKANRKDLVTKESQEIKILQEYLPPPMSDIEIEKLIATAIVETGAVSIKDVSKVINYMKAHLKGTVDFAKVVEKIKAKITQ